MSVDADGSGLRDDVHVSLTPGPVAEPGVPEPAQDGEDDQRCPDTSR